MCEKKFFPYFTLDFTLAKNESKMDSRFFTLVEKNGNESKVPILLSGPQAKIKKNIPALRGLYDIMRRMQLFLYIYIYIFT